MLQAVEEAKVQESLTRPEWNPATRIAFRFFFCYFLLFFLTNSEVVNLIPFADFLLRKYVAGWHQGILWLDRNALHTGLDIYRIEARDGVSNTAFGTILCLCYVAVAAVATAVWSALDRRRGEYGRLHQVFRYLLRFSLALTMLHYGIIKVIPTQMIAPPPLSVLMQRVGDLTRMRMLWISTGASPAYETIIGCAELLGAVLLMLPRTTLLGGLLCLGNLSMVFTLNMCYDVQVKLYSFHLLVMAALLVAPDARRLADVLLFNRATQPSQAPPLFANRWLDRAPHAFLFLFVLYKIGMTFPETWEWYKTFHPPRPPLYGIWNVQKFDLDGQSAPAPWRRLLFQQAGHLTVEAPTGPYQRYKLALNLKDRTLALAGPQQAKFAFSRPDADELILTGTLDGHPARLELRKMALISKPFHWIFDPPPEDRE